MHLATWARRLSWPIVGLTFCLIWLGWVGIARSEQLSGTGHTLLCQQMAWSVVGVVAMFSVTVPNYRIVCRQSYPLFGVTVVLLIGVYFFPPIHGVHRWIRVGMIGFQPSEFAKVTFVLALARYLMYRENYRRLFGLFAPILLALVPILLILHEPDLGTACVFLPVLMLMLYAAGARRRDVALVFAACLATMPLMWSQMSREQRSRVTALFEQTGPGEQPSHDAYHLHHAKQMLAQGGMWGNNEKAAVDRSAYYVPEAATDSIFVVLGERHGQVGVATLLVIYILLAWRGLVVAENTREPFGRIAVTGFVALISIEALTNTSMLVGLLPITGISLPLVSYGGSGLLAHCIAVGLVLNVGLRPGYEVAREPYRYVRE